MKLTKETRNQKLELSSKPTPGATKKIPCATPHPAGGQVNLGRTTLPSAEKDISPKGGEGGPSGRARSEAGRDRQPAWWERLPAGEKYVLRQIADHLRKAKADPTMAAAAAKWETRLICFIKFRLIGQAARSQRSTPLRRACRA
jgi:hypothetical protein